MPKDELEIYCPKCTWRPQPDDRWSCEPSCGTVWNTFWTRGLCPGCRRQWSDTQCLACRQFSPHKQWYHLPGRASSRRTRTRETDKRETDKRETDKRETDKRETDSVT